jgi:hypothetical protein
MARRPSSPKSRRGTATTAARPPSAAELFVEFVDGLGFQNGTDKIAPLRNMTFWMGAGFSKAWDTRFPTGKELFTLDAGELEHVIDFGPLSRTFGIDSDEPLPAERLYELVYQLDMQARYPDVRSRYVDAQNVAQMRGRLQAAIVRRLSRLSGLEPFDSTTNKFPLAGPDERKHSILDFFSYVLRKQSSSAGLTEGLRCHFVTTNYDNVIETVLDNVLGPDDTLFLYNYRGFSPSEIVGNQPLVPVHDHWLASYLIKINGGIEILRRGDGFALDYSNRSDQEIAVDPPVLMLPSREQDYRDPYFDTIFPKTVRLMRESTILVIVGYSLPEEDALMRFILRQFAEEPEDGRDKVVFYIDRLGRRTKLERLERLFPGRRGRNPLIVTFEGSFDLFVRRCLRIVEKQKRARARQWPVVRCPG